MMDIITPAETAGSALLGGVTAGSEWRDAKGAISWPMIAANLATAYVVAQIILGLCDIGDMFGYVLTLNIKLGLCAFGGYIGPKAIVAPIYNFILKRYGTTA